MCEYIIIFIYILDNNSRIIFIRREISIVDNLSTKVFIKMNIIKLKTIILDINKDLIIIEFYNLFLILIFIIIKGPRINITIINKIWFIILIYLFLIIIIESINLLINRDLIFELDQLNIFIFLINIVNYNLLRIIIRNDINLSITFNKYIRLSKIFKYKIEEYYLIEINLKNISIIDKFFKKSYSKFLIK